MGIEIRLPQITGATEKEQLAQIKSYLYQFAEQLQWGLQNVNTTNNAVVVQEMAKSLYPTGNTGSGTVQDPLATFAAIKSLIIKSADIVDAYYEMITEKLVGDYAALSEFGAFREQTEQKIKKTSTEINQTFTNTQTLVSNAISNAIAPIKKDLSSAQEGVAKLDSLPEEVSGLNTTVVDAFANITSGLLYVADNGVPVYGIEIGQKNEVNGEEVFNKFARFTADRLSFYDKNGVEIAYFSDSKLYITKAEVTGTLKLGGYSVDTSNGLTFKWAGRK